MIQVIRATVLFDGVHHWPDAPLHRGYLRHPHHHTFKVTAFAGVDHDDRAIEFHDFRLRLTNAVASLGQVRANEHGIVAYLGAMSCEMIGAKLLESLPEATKIEVDEDEYVGATVYRSEEPVEPEQDDECSGFVREWDFQIHRKRPPVVTLCGSTRFKDEFRKAEAGMEGKGWCVFTVGFFAHADGIPISEKAKQAADELHKWKISMSDWVYVVNPGGYIGDSTRSEINFAKDIGVPIRYLVEPEE